MSQLLSHFTSLSILLKKSNDYNSYMELFTISFFIALNCNALNIHSIDIICHKEYNPINRCQLSTNLVPGTNTKGFLILVSGTEIWYRNLVSKLA
jgi:hypothetical protein